MILIPRRPAVQLAAAAMICAGMSAPALATAHVAQAAAEKAITTYQLSTNAQVDQLRLGPDGALWFVTTDVLGRITSTGAITTWTPPWSAGGGSDNLTFGAGFLWVVEWHGGQSYISQWTLSGTLVHEFPVPQYDYAITWGPDSALWFSGGSLSGTELSNTFIGRMSTVGTVTQYPMPDTPSLAGDMTAGPDGAIWFSELPGTNVGRVSTAGAIVDWPVPGATNYACCSGANQTITVGPDGALWTAAGNLVARVALDGAVTTFPEPHTYPFSVATNPDGDIWYTDYAQAGAVIRMTTSGEQVSRYDTSDLLGPPTVITTGADGMIWFGTNGTINRLDPSIPPNSTPGPSVPATGGGVPWEGPGLILLGLATVAGVRTKRA